MQLWEFTKYTSADVLELTQVSFNQMQQKANGCRGG
jgi:hypothetical protein